MNNTVDDLQSERLVQPVSKAFPSNGLERFVDSRDDPDIAEERCHRRVSIFEKRYARKKHRRDPFVFQRRGQRIHHIGTLALSKHTRLRISTGPLRGASPGILYWIGDSVRFDCCSDLGIHISRRFPYIESSGSVSIRIECSS